MGKSMSANKKRELVQKAYQILTQEGIEEIKIRRLAKELGCTSTVVYKHFQDLEQLIIFASVRFLEGYIKDFKRILKENLNPVELNRSLWECFAGYAFRAVPIFENLFFGKYKESLGDVIFEYYQLFPDEMKDFDGYSVSVLYNDNLLERDFVLLRRGASMGFLTLENARILSELDCYLFHGMLMAHREDYKEEGKAEEAVAKFMKMLRDITNIYLKK